MKILTHSYFGIEIVDTLLLQKRSDFPLLLSIGCCTKKLNGRIVVTFILKKYKDNVLFYIKTYVGSIIMSSIGTILQEERKKQGYSIEDVAKATNIREKILLSIEQDSFDMLPAPYMRSFITKYVSFLKLQEVQKKAVLESPFMLEATSPSIQTKSSEQQGFSKNYLKLYGRTNGLSARKSFILTTISIITGLVLLGALYFVFLEDSLNLFRATTTAEITADTLTSDTTEQTADNSGTTSILIGEEEKDGIAEADSLVLQATATDRIWMSVVTDGGQTTQTIMEKGTSRSWKAGENFALSLGNAGGADFILNGERMLKFGELGTVVRNIKITRGTVTISNINFPLRERLLRTKLERDSIEAERKRELQEAATDQNSNS
jgi:cytoskeletal protein RodZ